MTVEERAISQPSFHGQNRHSGIVKRRGTYIYIILIKYFADTAKYHAEGSHLPASSPPCLCTMYSCNRPTKRPTAEIDWQSHVSGRASRGFQKGRENENSGLKKERVKRVFSKHAASVREAGEHLKHSCLLATCLGRCNQCPRSPLIIEACSPINYVSTTGIHSLVGTMLLAWNNEHLGVTLQIVVSWWSSGLVR